jgi:hypothetical protein
MANAQRARPWANELALSMRIGHCAGISALGIGHWALSYRTTRVPVATNVAPAPVFSIL